MRMRATLSAFALIAVAATTVEAQQAKSYEIGMDGQIAFGLGDTDGTAIQVPVQKVRFGFPISPVMTIEPSLAFVRFGNNGTSASDLAADVSLLYHFSQDRAANQFYVRPSVGFVRSSFDNGTTSGSESAFAFGVAGGIKIPLMDRLATRLEAEFRQIGETDTSGEITTLNLNFGLSFFTR